MSTDPFALTDFGSLGLGSSTFDTSAPPPDTTVITGFPTGVAPAVAAPSGISSFETAISGLSSLAAPWFTSITGNSVVPIPTSAAQAALQQTQIQQQAQAKLLATSPTAAGLLSNPTVVLVGIGVFALIFYLISKQK